MPFHTPWIDPHCVGQPPGDILRKKHGGLRKPVDRIQMILTQGFLVIQASVMGIPTSRREPIVDNGICCLTGTHTKSPCFSCSIFIMTGFSENEKYRPVIPTFLVRF
jgi:hypothetical protein